MTISDALLLQCSPKELEFAAELESEQLAQLSVASDISHVCLVVHVIIQITAMIMSQGVCTTLKNYTRSFLDVKWVWDSKSDPHFFNFFCT